MSDRRTDGRKCCETLHSKWLTAFAIIIIIKKIENCEPKLKIIDLQAQRIEKLLFCDEVADTFTLKRYYILKHVCGHFDVYSGTLYALVP